MGRGRGAGGDDDATMVFCGCTATTVFVSCFLLGFSFSTLGPHRMAFVYDANTHGHEWDKLYNVEDGGGGRFFLGLGRTFAYPFPRDVQRLLFNRESNAASGLIIAKSVEGIDIEIACSLQYQLVRSPGGLRALYERYGSLEPKPEDGDGTEPDEWGWTPYFTQYTRGIVRDVMADFNATALWKDRALLGARMRDAISAKLAVENAVLRGFQLLNLDIPEDLESSILATTVEGENVARARAELRSINESVITDVAVQGRLAEIDLLTAQASAFEVEASSQARNDSLRLTVEAEATAVTQLKNTLQLNSTEYLGLLFVDTVAAAAATRKTVGVTQPPDTTVPLG